MGAPIDKLMDGVELTRIATDPPEGTDPPVATHEGHLMLPTLTGEADLRVYQLSNGQRVFDADSVAAVFGGEFKP